MLYSVINLTFNPYSNTVVATIALAVSKSYLMRKYLIICALAWQQKSTDSGLVRIYFLSNDVLASSRNKTHLLPFYWMISVHYKGCINFTKYRTLFFYMLSSNSFLTYRAGNVRLLGKLKAISICASCPWPALHQLLQPLEQTTIPQHLRRTDLKFQMTVVYWRCHKAKAVYCNRWTVCGPCISVLDGNDWSNILCLILPSRTFLLD